MKHKQCSKILFCFLITIFSSFSTQMITLDLIESNTLVVSSIQVPSGQLIWLQQVREDIKTTNKKVFQRIKYDFPEIRRYKFYDNNNEFEMKAWDQIQFTCALFHNKTADNFFIYKFPQEELQTGQIVEIPESVFMGKDKSKVKLLLGSSCQQIAIDELQIYIASEYRQKNYQTGKQTVRTDWKYIAYLIEYKVLGFDHQLYTILTTEAIYYLDSQQNNNFYYDKITGDYIEYWETIDNYKFGTPLLLERFQGGRGQIKNHIYQPNNQDEEIQIRTIILVSKQNETTPGVYDYALIVILVTPLTGVSIVHESTNKSYGMPKLVASEKHSRVIVYGNTTEGKPFYEGYYLLYSLGESQPIVFPPSVTNHNNFLALSENYLYCRNRNLPPNNKGNHSAYVFVKERIYSYFEQQVIEQSQLNSNWVTAYIETVLQVEGTAFLDLRIIFINYYAFMNQHYITLQAAGPFNQMQQVEYSNFSPYEYQFSFDQPPVSQEKLLVSAQKGFRWIYAIEKLPKDPKVPITKIYIDTFDQETYEEQTFAINIKYMAQFYFQKYMISPQLDCFYIEDIPNRTLKFFRFDGTKIQYLADIKPDDPNTKLPTTNKPTQQNYIVMASKCQVIKVFRLSYSLVQSSGKISFQKTPSSQVDESKPRFDSSNIFAYQGQSLYKYNGIKYQKIITTDLKENSFMSSNKEKNKVILVTYRQSNQQQINPETNRSKIVWFLEMEYKIFYQVNNLWKQLPTKSQSTINKKIQEFYTVIQASVSFERAVFCYADKTQQLKNECIFLIIDYELEKVYQSFYVVQSTVFPFSADLLEKYIYLTEGDKLSTDSREKNVYCKQNIFEIVQNKVVLIVSYQTACEHFSKGFQKRIIVENETDSTITFFYEYVNKNHVKIVITPPQTVEMMNSQLHLSINTVIDKGLFLQNQKLHFCTPGCLSCFNSYYCMSCVPGYALNIKNYKCIKCEGFCDACKFEKPSQCLSCPRGFFLQKKSLKCLSCHVNCDTCDGLSETKCLTCKIGYFKNDGIEPSKKRTCLQCPLNCQKCFNSTQCLSCQYGYTLTSKGFCIKCPLDCIQCNAQNIYECISCRIGYQMVTIEGHKQCKKCPINCVSCTQQKCSQCKQGFFLNQSNNNCQTFCDAPCLNCRPNDSRNCTQCISGYVLNGTKCVADISCNQEMACVSCPSGFTLIAKKCYECGLIQNCQQCQSEDPTICVGCLEGFYLMNNLCQPCASSCRRCYSNTICEECKQGYILSKSEQVASQCLVCAANCKSCTQSVTNCLSCASGYKLVGPSCIKEKSVFFMIKMDIDQSKFNLAVYTKFIQDLEKASQKSKLYILVSSVKVGSVTIQGTVDVANTDQQFSVLDGFYSAFTAGSQIAGNQILESNFVGFTPLIFIEEEKKDNLPIILGTVIPGIIIFSGLLALFIYKKFFAPVQQVEVKQQSDRSSETDLSQIGNKKQTNKKSPRKTKNGFMPKIQRKIKTQNSLSIPSKVLP